MIRARKHESISHMLMRFNRQDARYGTQKEYRKHSVYEKPRVARKRKSQRARRFARSRGRRSRRRPRRYRFRGGFYSNRK